MQQRDHRSTDTGPAHSTMRRRRLWEVPPAVHGPLVGLGMTAGELRRSMDRSFHGNSALDDASLHAAVVAQCGTRNKVSETLQRAFDARFVQMLARFRSARTCDAVEALWRQVLAEGSVAAGLWGASTHPCADVQFQTDICNDVQLAQCRAVWAIDAERRRADALLHENGVLAREMARIQQRQTRWQAERQAEQSALATVRLDVIRLQAELAARDRAVEAMLRPEGDGTAAEPRSAAAAERRLRRAPGTGLAARPPAEVRDVAPVAAYAAPAEDASDVGALVDAVGEARRILCVGGRTGHVPIYRALVEEQGGRFLHHDGGIEDNVRRLDAQLSAADLVICQTGCLSHNAYWRVKDHCKRTGTPCVYLEQPGTGSFLRGLMVGAAASEVTSAAAGTLDCAGD